MLKHSITYENYDEEEVTEELYFNLTKNELIELEVEHQEGLEGWINKIIAAKDRKTIYDETKKIVVMAYGEKTPDGRSFLKTPEITENFAHTAAFHKLMEELIMDENKAATFMIGILPKDLASKVEAEEQKKKQKAQAEEEKSTEAAPNS